MTRPLAFDGHGEPSLLADRHHRAWAGLPLGIFEARSHQFQGEAPFGCLAMVLGGRSRARIISRGQDCDFSPDDQTVGLFGPELSVQHARWTCEPGGRRIVVGLDWSELARSGDLETLRANGRDLRQDLQIRDPQIAGHLRLMAAEVSAGSPHGSLYAQSLCLSLAELLFERHGNGGTGPRLEHGALTPAQRSQVIAYIEHRYRRDITLEELAALVGVSRHRFLQMFRRSFGMTPYRYVLARRRRLPQAA
ncbi:MAG: AraC family transcriptional regulator [Burkholderiaceae bacterium]|nr:AraC family transcriptional regulator [Burkholderiaceae bacterium]